MKTSKNDIHICSRHIVPSPIYNSAATKILCQSIEPHTMKARNWPLYNMVDCLADAKQNFNKYGHGYIDSLGVPYDYGSIMHYGKSDFAIQPGLVTIRVLQPGASIGRAEHLSELDVKQMKLYYSCWI